MLKRIPDIEAVEIAVRYAIEQPEDVDVNEIIVRLTATQN